MADVTDVQTIAGRQQRLQKQISIILPAGTVPGAIKPLQSHEIKIQGHPAAGVFSVVHAQQTHHLKGNGPHGHHGTEIHHPGQEPLGGTGIGHGRHDMVPHHGKLQV